MLFKKSFYKYRNRCQRSWMIGPDLFKMDMVGTWPILAPLWMCRGCILWAFVLASQYFVMHVEINIYFRYSNSTIGLGRRIGRKTSNCRKNDGVSFWSLVCPFIWQSAFETFWLNLLPGFTGISFVALDSFCLSSCCDRSYIEAGFSLLSFSVPAYVKQ